MTDRFPAVSPARRGAGHPDRRRRRSRRRPPPRAAASRCQTRQHPADAAGAEGEQRILLTDFGIARQSSTASEAAARLRRAGTVGGCRRRRARRPVRVGGDRVSPADRRTAGHADTGAYPATAPPRLSDQRPELARLDAVFARALAADPADRFATCRDVRRRGERTRRRIGRRPRPRCRVRGRISHLAGPDDLAGARSAAKLQPAAWHKEATSTPTRSAPKGVTPSFLDSSAATTAAARETGDSRFAPPSRRSPRRLVLAAAAAVLVAALLVVGFLSRARWTRRRPDRRCPGRRTGAGAGRRTDIGQPADPAGPTRRHLPPRGRPFEADVQLDARPATARREQLVGVPLVVHPERLQRGRGAARRQRPQQGEDPRRPAGPLGFPRRQLDSPARPPAGWPASDPAAPRPSRPPARC